MLASRPMRTAYTLNLRSGSILGVNTITPAKAAVFDLMLRHDDVVQAVEALQVRPKRLRAFELDRMLHCSVIGTCLDLVEIRRLVFNSPTWLLRARTITPCTKPPCCSSSDPMSLAGRSPESSIASSAR